MMSKNYKRLMLSCLLWQLIFPAYALSEEEARLIQKDFQLYQAWSLSRNYYFGNTYPADRVKALAWQIVYTDLLPPTYPQRNENLAFYKAGLTATQISEAADLAHKFITDYHLSAPFTEGELTRAYDFRDRELPWQSLTFNTLSTQQAQPFKQWLQWLDNQGQHEKAIAFEQYVQGLRVKKQFPIVYGQVFIKGPASPEMVISNVRINAQGYFIAPIKSPALFFSLPGYQTRIIPVQSSQELQAITPVIMEPLPSSKQTGVVGRVMPWKGTNQGNILLRAVLPEGSQPKNPWQYPVVPLTVTNSGEFYTTGLTPGKYELFINTMGIKTVVKFAVKKDEVRGLSVIDLRGKKII